MLMIQLVFGSRRIQAARQGWQTICIQDTSSPLLIFPEKPGKAALLSLLLDRYQLSFTCFTKLQNFLWCCLTAYGKKTNNVGLIHRTESRIVSPSIALPVRVIGDVTRWNCDRVVIGQRWKRSWSRQAELGVQWNASRATRINGQKATDTLPYASRLNSVFLSNALVYTEVYSHSLTTNLVNSYHIWCRLGRFNYVASHGGFYWLWVCETSIK